MKPAQDLMELVTPPITGAIVCTNFLHQVTLKFDSQIFLKTFDKIYISVRLGTNVITAFNNITIIFLQAQCNEKRGALVS